MEVKKKLKIIIPVAAAAAVVCAGIGIYFYGYHKYQKVFLPNTYINGMDVSNLTPEEFEEKLQSGDNYNVITLLEADGTTETIDLADVVKSAQLEEDPAEFLSEEDAKGWILRKSSTRDYEDPLIVEYDYDKLEENIKSLSAFSSADIVDSTDAYFHKNADGNFEIVSETYGNRLDEEKVIELVEEAVESGETEIDLTAAGAYITPSVKADDPSLTGLLDAFNNMLNMVITINMTGATETLDSSTYSSWIEWDGESSFYFDREDIENYVSELNTKYWTFQTTRNFVNHNGETIQVGGGTRDTYGFWMNKDVTTAELVEVLNAGQSADFAPTWRVEAETRDQANGDIGGDYIEISLDEQKMFLYLDYQQVMEINITSGTKTNAEYNTPTGVFSLLSKRKDHTMTGSYGTQFCNFFMVFDWTGCGIHDAWWRDASSFGGSTYVNSGSHGCINTPLDDMTRLFDQVWIGMPVVIYGESDFESVPVDWSSIEANTVDPEQ